MSEAIPINPDVLRWARESAGFKVEDVAARMKKSVNAICKWESGENAPTYVQLETLAYKIYKRPIALFFFPEPPEEEPPKQSFRTLPEYEISKMPPRLRYLIRQAKVMQINLAELNDGVNPASKQILHELNFKPGSQVLDMAARVRKYFGIDLEKQRLWKNEDKAFKAWRDILEEHGIFVFKEAFKDDSFSGFCLDDKQFPVIYVNNSKPHVRQIFTLFHELVHLFLGTGGVDTRMDNYIDLLTGDDRKTEILCNRFAGAFLVPDDDFNMRTANIRINEAIIEELAERYHVSREVILRKFCDLGKVSNADYEAQVDKWEKIKRKKSGTGGDYYRTQSVYLGKNYLNLAFSRYYQHRISIDQLANYLGVKVRNVGGMESLLFGKGAA